MGFLSESDSSRKVTLKSVLAVAVLGPDGYQECVGIWHLAGSEMPTSDRRKLPVQECICIWLLAGSEMLMSDRRKLPVRRPHSPHYLRGTFSNTGGCSFYSLGFGSPVSRDEWLGRWQCSSEHWHSHRSRSTVSPISKRGLRRVCLARFAIPCLLNRPLKPRKGKNADVARGKPQGISSSSPFRGRLTPCGRAWNIGIWRQHP